MKKIILSIFIFVGLLFCFNGCRIDEGDYKPDNTGYNMFSAWNIGMRDASEFFMDIAFRFNTWLMAPDSLKPMIEDQYLFPYTVCSNTADSWKLVSQGKTAYIVETDGRLLSEMAHWVITKCVGENGHGICRYGFSCINYNDISFLQDNLRMEIRTIQPYQWQVSINPKEQYDSTDVYLEAVLAVPSHEMPNKLDNVSYELSGWGRFVFDDNNYGYSGESAYLDFQIEEPVVSAIQKPACWTSGMVLLKGHQSSMENERTVRLFKDENGFSASFYLNEDPQSGVVDYYYAK